VTPEQKSKPSGGARHTLAQTWARVVSHMEPRVFFPAAAVVIGFVLFGTLFTDAARSTFNALQAGITAYFGWGYILIASCLLVFVLVLLVSPFGSIRLGGEDTEPDFPMVTWFTMMLSAGMGIGIVFFGVAEPLEHYVNPPLGGQGQSVRDAMRYTFFHWGLHPWAIYSCIALPLAYFHFRHGLPLAPRSMLYPLIGDRIYGWIGHAVDTLCTVGTLFGVATSLGLGAQQINAGLSRVAGLEQTTGAQVAIIAGITLIATVSVVSGLKVGIRRLSEFNLGLFALILLFVLITGPTLFQIETFVASMGSYLQTLPTLSLETNPGTSKGWQADWTLFYWSWWISWSPFVGVFTARISKGRTVREFILAAMLVPTLFGFLWFAVVGGAGVSLELESPGFASEAIENTALSLFSVLDELPLSDVTAVAAILLVIIFFVTSSDSGSFVDDMVTSGGDPNPPRIQRVFWAVSEGGVAVTLLLAGGLRALRTASLTTGVPIALFLCVGCVGLWRALRIDHGKRGVVETERLAD